MRVSFVVLLIPFVAACSSGVDDVPANSAGGAGSSTSTVGAGATDTGGVGATDTGGAGATTTDPGSKDGSIDCLGATGHSACPSPAPDYDSQILPVLNAKCNNAGCHKKGDPVAWPLISTEDLGHWWSTVKGDVAGCTMPPAGSPALTADERGLLLDWLACNKPKNP